MFGGTHGYLVLREDLVLMRIEYDVLVTRRGVHEAIPVCLKVLEGIVDASSVVVAAALDCLVAILIKCLDLVKIERAPEGFVEEFDSGDDISIRGVSLSKVLNGCDRLGYGITLLPVDGTIAAAVVKSILTAGCWSKVTLAGSQVHHSMSTLPPCRSSKTLRPALRAQVIALSKIGSCPCTYGSPVRGATAQ